MRLACFGAELPVRPVAVAAAGSGRYSAGERVAIAKTAAAYGLMVARSAWLSSSLTDAACGGDLILTVQ